MPAHCSAFNSVLSAALIGKPMAVMPVFFLVYVIEPPLMCALVMAVHAGGQS